MQSLAPGTPILYRAIPDILDPRTAICAFGSPEQGLMAAAMAQLAHFCGFPVHLNVNLTDAKLPDVQAGMEKIGNFILGTLAEADLFGHAGIVGTDHGASLEWLVIDNEAMNYARRVARGFRIDDVTLAGEVISRVGPGGNFLSDDHTLAHFREELSIPTPSWTRDTYEVWKEKSADTMGGRAASYVNEILAKHQVPPSIPRWTE